jgi:hypothetical protein
VNGGNTSGIADIFFKHIDDGERCSSCNKIKEVGKKHECSKWVNCVKSGKSYTLPACSAEPFVYKNKNFLFSAKYYLTERNLPSYDIDKRRYKSKSNE